MIVKKIKKIINIERASLVVVFQRILQSGIGLIVMLLVPVYVSKTEQGYYYTFISLAAMQVIFELGMNQVVINFFSHESSEETKIESKKIYYTRKIKELLFIFRKAYIKISIAYLVVALPIGIAVLSKGAYIGIEKWLYPWILLACSNGLLIYTIFPLSALEGLGNVEYIAKKRIVMNVFAGLVSVLGLMSGIGLWVPFLSSLTSGAIAILATRSFIVVDKRFGSNAINAWKFKISNFQKKIAISSICGYMTMYLFTPIAFMRMGAVEAGKLGLSLAICNSVTGVAVGLIASKVPDLGRHISKNSRVEALKILKEMMAKGTAIVLSSSFAFVALLIVLSELKIDYFARVLPPKGLAYLMGVSLCNAIIYSIAAYMRAHQEEDMIIPSVASGVGSLSVAYAYSAVGSSKVVFGYFLSTILVVLPITCLIFWSRYLKEDGK